MSLRPAAQGNPVSGKIIIIIINKIWKQQVCITDPECSALDYTLEFVHGRIILELASADSMLQPQKQVYLECGFTGSTGNRLPPPHYFPGPSILPEDISKTYHRDSPPRNGGSGDVAESSPLHSW